MADTTHSSTETQAENNQVEEDTNNAQPINESPQKAQTVFAAGIDFGSTKIVSFFFEPVLFWVTIVGSQN